MLHQGKRRLVPVVVLGLRRRALIAAILCAVILAPVLSAAAQTATPTTIPPTAVLLTVPTAELFAETNTWIGVFAPVAAIGIGIAIALAILGYLGSMIKKAFN